MQVYNEQANIVVVLPGELLTLMDLLMSWWLSTMSASSNTSNQPVPIFLFRTPWQQLLESTATTLGISQSMLQRLTYFDTVDELMSLIKQMS